MYIYLYTHLYVRLANRRRIFWTWLRLADTLTRLSVPPKWVYTLSRHYHTHTPCPFRLRRTVFTEIKSCAPNNDENVFFHIWPRPPARLRYNRSTENIYTHDRVVPFSWLWQRRTRRVTLRPLFRPTFYITERATPDAASAPASAIRAQKKRPVENTESRLELIVFHCKRTACKP